MVSGERGKAGGRGKQIGQATGERGGFLGNFRFLLLSQEIFSCILLTARKGNSPAKCLRIIRNS